MWGYKKGTEIINQKPKIKEIVFSISHFSLLSFCILCFTNCAATPDVLKTERAELWNCNSDIIALIQRRSEDLKTLKGTAHVAVNFADGKELSGRAVVLVKRPNLFRLEVLGPFNQTIAVVTYNGKSLSLFSFQENKLYKDYPSPIDAFRLPQYFLGLPAADISQELGVISQHENAASISQLSTPCLIKLETENILINREGAIQEITLPASGLTEKAYTIRASMNSYKEVNDLIFPFAISINNESANISIRYEDIELNQHISEDLFDLQYMEERK